MIAPTIKMAAETCSKENRSKENVLIQVYDLTKKKKNKQEVIAGKVWYLWCYL